MQLAVDILASGGRGKAGGAKAKAVDLRGSHWWRGEGWLEAAAGHQPVYSPLSWSLLLSMALTPP